MISVIALPIVVAGVLAAQHEVRDDLHAGDHPPAVVDELDAELRRKLAERIDLIQQDAPAEQVLSTLSGVTGIPIFVDRDLPRRGEHVTVDVRDRPVGEALDRVTAAIGARWRGKGSRILVAAGPIAAGPIAEGGAAAPYPQVTFDFTETSLRDAADTLAMLTGRKIGVTDGVAGETVTLKGAGMRLDQALAMMTQLTGTAWTVAKDGAIVIGPGKQP